MIDSAVAGNELEEFFKENHQILMKQTAASALQRHHFHRVLLLTIESPITADC